MHEIDLSGALEQRADTEHVRRRLSLEAEHEQRLCAGGVDWLHIDRWHSVIRASLRLAGLYRRARHNTTRVQVRHNIIRLAELPPAFDGFTLLQLSDLHADMSGGAMARLVELLPDLRYDACALTGDYRGKTFGPFAAAMDQVARVRERLSGEVYGILGNHDSIRMVPGLERLGIRMLVNETVALKRHGQRLHLAGIDDAHFFRTHDLVKVAAAVPPGECAVLLSHTPEVYREAAQAGFAALLAGHTHGGQICLPGRVPITLDADVPRRLGAGPWQYGGMVGYTSVGVGASIVTARLNCPPEITLHRLEHAPAQWGRSRMPSR
jgi:predicted MPP superfamily phosphohydrolase